MLLAILLLNRKITRFRVLGSGLLFKVLQKISAKPYNKRLDPNSLFKRWNCAIAKDLFGGL